MNKDTLQMFIVLYWLGLQWKLYEYVSNDSEKLGLEVAPPPFLTIA